MLQQETLSTTSHLATNRAVHAASSGVLPMPALPTQQRMRRTARRAGRALVRVGGEVVWLPSSLRDFVLFMLALAAITGCLVLHLSLSVKILRLERQIATVTAQHERIEQQNAELTFRIAEASALSKMQTRTEALGFVNGNTQYYALPAGELAGRSTESSTIDAAENEPATGQSVQRASTASSSSTQTQSSVLTRLFYALNIRP